MKIDNQYVKNIIEAFVSHSKPTMTVNDFKAVNLFSQS